VLIRRRAATGVLALASFAVGLAAAEAFFRLARLRVTDWAYNTRKYGRLITYDPAGGFTRQIPHARGEAYGAPVRFNAFGMRDVERTLAKPPGTRRVLVLGDSVAVGVGERFDDIFPRRLEALLARDGAGGPVEVVAAAVSGWNTVAQRDYLRAEGLRFEPDLVIVLYVTNDNEIALPWAPRPPAPPLARAWQWLSDRSRLVEVATFAYRKRRPARPDPERLRAAGEVTRARARRRAEPHRFEPDDRGWLASRAALEDIAARTRERGVGLLVVLADFGGPDSAAVTARLGEFSAATGVPVANALPWFGGRPVTELLNAALHPNALAHRIMAEETARIVGERGLLRRGAPGGLEPADRPRG
jgi:lysophospholipase L1-like esterase